MNHTRIPRWAIIAVTLLVIGVLITSVALAQPGGGTSAPSTGTALSGGRYQLITTSASANAPASGGGYRLLAPTPVPVPASGCCCKTSLPCVVR